MSVNYIGTSGIVVQTLPEIREQITQKFKEIYGEDINIDQNSPDGQLIGLWSQEKKDMLDFMVQIYNNLDPDNVVGLQQQILYKLNGLEIKAFNYSYTYVQITTDRSLTLEGLDENINNENGAGYTVVDESGNRWILAETSNLETGENTLNFRAAALGGVNALANTINAAETIVGGVVSINNNAATYLIGGVGETSAEFRQRRTRSIAIPSQGFDEALEAQLLNIDNVTQAKVYDNRTGSTSQGIPPHTVWVIVEGGLSEDIGRAIYNNIPPGIAMKGDEEVEITKSNGDIETINYDVPTAVPLYVKANITNFGTSTLDTDYYKQELAKNTFNIQEKAEVSKLICKLKEIIEDSGTPYDMQLSLNGTVWNDDFVVPSGLDEFLSLAVENITLTVAE